MKMTRETLSGRVEVEFFVAFYRHLYNCQIRRDARILLLFINPYGSENVRLCPYYNADILGNLFSFIVFH